MRWILSLASQDSTIHNKTGLKNQVLDALWSCTDEGLKDNYVQDEIPTLEADKVLPLISSQGRKETNHTLNEIDSEDLENELDSLDLLRKERESLSEIYSEKHAMQITRDKLAEAKKVNELCQKVLETMSKNLSSQGVKGS